MNKNLSVVGVGRLGLCFALTLERAGFNVLGVDVDQAYVDSINEKTLKSPEPNVEKFLKESKNFTATTDLKAALEHSEFIYVVVATPSLKNGHYDHSQIDSLVDKMQTFGTQSKTKNLVICCTTMPEYCDQVADKIQDYNYTVSYNPEFIAQGSILRDQASPDIVLIGEANEEVGKEIANHYVQMTNNVPKICKMSRTEAEITKISLNSFLTTKITFANMVGDVVKRAGYEPDRVLAAIGSDTRVGNKYLKHGYGYGGPCFPRDNRAFSAYAKSRYIFPLLPSAVDDYNSLHLSYQVDDFVAKNSVDEPVVLTQLTYKPGTTILEESQQLRFAVHLARRGYNVIIREDPRVIKEIKEKHGMLFEYEER